MRLTEALHYYSTPNLTDAWMRLHYSHFWPTDEERVLKAELTKNRKPKVGSTKKPLLMKDLFE